MSFVDLKEDPVTAAPDDELHEKVLAELDQTKQQVSQLTQELKEAKTKLHQLVYRDGLSGLYNYRYFQEMLSKELERSIRYSSPFSLAIFCMNTPVEGNTPCGPEKSDLILMNIARIVEREVRPTDVVARYSNDEFALILPETDNSGARVFVERLYKNIQEMATLIDGKEIKATISIGGVTYLPGVTKAGTSKLVQSAENALSSARKKSSNPIEILELT